MPIRRRGSTAAQRRSEPARRTAPVPDRTLPPEQGGLDPRTEPHGDLSHIAEDLRPLARPVAELVGMAHNPRNHDERSYAAIGASYAEFRQLKPLVLEADGRTVIAGNGALAAARQRGITHLACVNSGLQGAAARKFAIADNRVAELSVFDREILGNDLASLGDMSVLGFSEAEAFPLVSEARGAGSGQVPSWTPTAPPDGGTPGAAPFPSDPGQAGSAGPGGPPEPQVQERSATGPEAQPLPDRGVPVVSYAIVFDDVAQQDRFFRFLRMLSARYPEPGMTKAARLDRYLVETFGNTVGAPTS